MPPILSFKLTLLQIIALIGILSRESNGQVGNSSSVLTSSTLKSAVVTESGFVAVLDNSTVYLLAGDLTEILNSDDREGVSPEGIGLALSVGMLFVCWANSERRDIDQPPINTAPCQVYDSSNLDFLVNVILPEDNGVGAPIGNTYTVIDGVMSEHNMIVLSSSFDDSEDKRLYHREYNILDGTVVREETKTVERNNLMSRIYYSGISDGDNTYIVAKDIERGGLVRVIRVCDGNAWDSWYEIQLTCGPITGTTGEHHTDLIDVDFITGDESDAHDESTLVITVLSEAGSSDVCHFLLHDIDTTARNLLEYCQNNRVELSFPWLINDVGECGSRVSN